MIYLFSTCTTDRLFAKQKNALPIQPVLFFQQAISKNSVFTALERWNVQKMAQEKGVMFNFT
jgi:hypothetical protein